MITIAVVLPTTRNMIGSKSLHDLVEFYRRSSNQISSQICQAAITCHARAYGLKHKVREIGNGDFKKKLQHVTLTLDFDDINDMAKFMSMYSMLVS